MGDIIFGSQETTRFERVVDVVVRAFLGRVNIFPLFFGRIRLNDLIIFPRTELHHDWW